MATDYFWFSKKDADADAGRLVTMGSIPFRHIGYALGLDNDTGLVHQFNLISKDPVAPRGAEFVTAAEKESSFDILVSCSGDISQAGKQFCAIRGLPVTLDALIAETKDFVQPESTFKMKIGNIPNPRREPGLKGITY